MWGVGVVFGCIDVQLLGGICMHEWVVECVRVSVYSRHVQKHMN